MATRQYIGARYVPKFADPIEWGSQYSYESLTIVNYLGASYTSKKPVPAGVLPTNTEYWALTGNYNAQIEQYRQEVDALSDEVDAIAAASVTTDRIKNKKIVIYGASGSVDTSGTWVHYFKPRMESLGCTVTVRAQGGKCLTRFNSATGGPCVSQMLYDATAEDLGQFDMIIIYAGVNDFREGIPLGDVTAAPIPSKDVNVNASFNSGLASIADSIHNKAPGAMVFVMSPLPSWEMFEAEGDTKHWGHYPPTFDPTKPLIVYANAMQQWCNVNGFTFIDGKGAPMLMPTNAAMRTQWQNGGLHTNANYALILADYIFFHVLTLVTDSSHWPDIRFNLKDLNAKMISAGMDGFLVADYINLDATAVTGYFHNDSTFTLHFLLYGALETGVDQIVMTLPESMQPNGSIYATCNTTLSGAASVAAVTIDSDGDVHIKPVVTGSQYIAIDVTYTLKCCGRRDWSYQPIVYNV